MTVRSLNGVIKHLRRVAAAQSRRALADDELLARFVAANDDAAFTALLERHGRMVQGVCLRALGNVHDAEDACQATFLVLARKAASIRKTTSLSSWLHGVACRAAADLKRDRARRERRRQTLTPPGRNDTADEVTWREVQAVLDEELAQLAPRYRTPLVLCYLDGKTRDEAAQQLGVSSGTLHGWLERGRRLLRRRLTQRGLTLSAALLAAALGQSVAHAALPPTLAVSCTKAAMLLAAGRAVPDSLVAAKVLALTKGVLKAMFLNKIKLGAAAVLSAGLAVALVNGSLSTVSLAQDTKATPAKEAAAATTESDADFIRRISKDLRGCAPTPAEVHFFAASKDAGKRQKLIDLFIQERQAKKDAQARADAAKPWLTGTIPVTNTPFVNQPFIIHDGTVRFANQPFLLSQNTLTPFHGTITSSGTLFTIHSAAASPKLGTLQSEFYKGLFTAKEKSDVARITQTYLDRLSQYVKDNPKNEDVADAMLQILRVYESQSKTVEAGAWRDKLRKEHPKSAAAKSLTGG